MKTVLAVLGVLTVSLALAADAKEDAIKKEQEKLNGTWKIVSITDDGKEAAKDDLKLVAMSIKGDTYTFRFGEFVDKGTSKLDPTKTPKTIDHFSTELPLKDNKPLLGIYELSDDTYKECFAFPGKDRPTVLSGKAGSGNTLYVWKREKP